MNYFIRELRNKTGLSQKAFSEKYGIPISTLRKWEQGEAKSAKYFVDLLALTVPGIEDSLKTYRYGDKIYYYGPVKKQVSDHLGNWIKINEDLEGVIEQNLEFYFDDLFNGFYELTERFEKDCRLDKKEGLIWSKK